MEHAVGEAAFRFGEGNDHTDTGATCSSSSSTPQQSGAGHWDPLRQILPLERNRCHSCILFDLFLRLLISSLCEHRRRDSSYNLSHYECGLGQRIFGEDEATVVVVECVTNTSGLVRHATIPLLSCCCQARLPPGTG